MPEHNDDDRPAKAKITQLKPGQRAKVNEKRPPAEKLVTWPAPELAAIAGTIINSRRLHMGALRSVPIAFAWSNAEREGDPNNVAKATRFNRQYAFLVAGQGKQVPEFVLRVSKPQWDRIPEDLQEQAMYHYLLHFSTDTDGRPRIETPDVIGFSAELEEFKGQQRWNAGFIRARQMGLFDGVASAAVGEARIAVPK